MGTFAQHNGFGVLATSTIVLPIYSTGFFNPEYLLAALLAGSAGANAPDIDHDEGLYLNIFFLAITILALSLFTYLFTSNYVLVRKFGWLAFVIAALVLYFIINNGVRYVFERLTAHRGIWHSILMMLFLHHVLLYCLVFYAKFPPKESCLISLSFAIGFTSHLLLDEWFSVDISNKRIKRSFGTALKFTSYKRRGKIHPPLVAVNLLLLTLLVSMSVNLPNPQTGSIVNGKASYKLNDKDPLTFYGMFLRSEFWLHLNSKMIPHG